MFKRSFWPCTRLFYDTLCTYSIIVGFSLLRVCFSAYVFFVYACSTNVLVNKDWYINNAAIFVTNFQSSTGQREGLCARVYTGMWVWQGWLVTPSVKERKNYITKNITSHATLLANERVRPRSDSQFHLCWHKISQSLITASIPTTAMKQPFPSPCPLPLLPSPI